MSSSHQQLVSLIFAVLFASVYGAIPDFIKKCSQKDPDLNGCIVRNGNDALKHILDGNKALQVPKLNPLVIPHVETTSGNLKFSADNVTIFGCDTLNLVKSKADFQKKVGEISLHGKKFEINGIYDIKGQILVLPIVGNGPINVKLDDVDFNFHFTFDLFEKDGHMHSKLLTSKLDWDAKKTSYKLDNLFNGDERLGTEMNKFMNENWKEINKELGQVIIDPIKQITDNIFKKMTDKNALDEIFD